ncbi:hypothetical protein O181_024095, partial [Austropuccinia psidii MF-1]|nr:hypothetical protein [Austropuccinia psidii MF-1]
LNRVAVEHCCWGPIQHQALLLDKQKDQSKPPQQTGNQGKGKTPSRGQGRKRNFHCKNKEEDLFKRLENLEKLVAKFDLNSKEPNVNVVSENNKESAGNTQQSDLNTYVVEDEVLNVGSEESNMIYLDSGAGRSVVNDLRYLTKIIKVKKHFNTYVDPVKISHQGTLVFHGIHLSPVYYAPKGKVNLLSVSQIINHGLNPVFKSGSFLIIKDKRIIATFNRMGNLFATKIHSQSILAVSPSEIKKDWHLILRHPSYFYIKKLISDQRLTGAFTPSSEFQLHMDTLEVSPPIRQGICYVLVIIDDFKPKPRYNYVPYYDIAPQEVSNEVSQQNILRGEKHNQHPLDQLILPDVVMYKQALTNQGEEKSWKMAMKQEYEPLMNHNTGELVPYPTNMYKLIRGMWRLTQKRNEFGEVYCYKA